MSPSATPSGAALRRVPETRPGYRQNFALDADRILHSKAYTRYIDKTQVFCLVDNDHITHRGLHVQLVSRIARTIGRFLSLNEDLIEAIALGHDIGHPPFGHDGETFLSELCVQHGLPPFLHNVQSVHFLDRLERKGTGWNLSLQTLDGILCHDGETHSRALTAMPGGNFDDLDTKIARKEGDPSCVLTNMTLEGCVVKLADTAAYIGRDIEDAITLDLIRRSDIPAECRTILGETNGSIVYTLVTDLITNSSVTPPGTPTSDSRDHIGYSEDVAAALQKLKAFNYEKIYLNPLTKKSAPRIRECYERLFVSLTHQLSGSADTCLPQIDLIRKKMEASSGDQTPEAIVRDYIAGMTDDFFLNQAAAVGCTIPENT
ncbi:MAG: HD domain-containing protein [Desulfocapsaceae bacterium]|nr:HD domain-containing protein [Desulfocapsaceae bacterium]